MFTRNRVLRYRSVAVVVTQRRERVGGDYANDPRRTRDFDETVFRSDRSHNDFVRVGVYSNGFTDIDKFVCKQGCTTGGRS